MDERSKKIRLGLILQGCVEAALKLTSYNSFSATPKYDPDSMTPDFLIPNSTSPKFFVEVTQTENRDSFKRKTLRYFEAVCDAKVHFGNKVVSVNILMGDPSSELPESNVKTMYSFFDANLNPRGDASSPSIIARLVGLEAEALKLAGDESNKDVNSAMPTLLKKHPGAIGDLAKQLESLLEEADAKAHLYELWNLERDRLMTLGEVDGLMKDAPTYKRPILNSLFFSDEHFESLVSTRDPNQLPDEIKTQLVTCKLATARKVIGGERLELERNFLGSISDPKQARRFRRVCSDVIIVDHSMRFFFLDIQSAERRTRMAEILWPTLQRGGEAIANAVACSLSDSNWQEVFHPQRCWPADLAALFLGVSHNELNRRLVQRGADALSLGNPFNQLSIKSERFMASPTEHLKYSQSIGEVFDEIILEGSNLATSIEELGKRLLGLRLHGAISLQKLNPLHLVVQAEAEKLGASVHYGLVDNVISDFATDNTATGRFKIFSIIRGVDEVLVNALYVDDYGGLDKAKEWASRGRSFLYRFDEDSGIKKRRRALLFVADGSWKPESIRKLRAAGWKVIRLSEFGSTLEALLGDS